MYSTWNKLSLAGILSHEEEVSRGESVESVESERDYEEKNLNTDFGGDRNVLYLCPTKCLRGTILIYDSPSFLNREENSWRHKS